MILAKLQPLVDAGMVKPLFLSPDVYQQTRALVLTPVSELAKGLEEGTEARAHTDALVEILGTDDPDEYRLAKELLFFAEIFATEDIPEAQQIVVSQFVPSARAFFSRAQQAHYHMERCTVLLKTLSTEEQIAHDKTLFENEGMMYCLEFYLAIYKKLIDTPAPAERRKLVESTHIDLGFGDVPGLWHDLQSDEVLSKFILQVLDKPIRRTLLDAYYDMKAVVMQVDIHCDKQEHCTVSYDDVTMEDIMVSLQVFLQSLMSVYTQVGILRLQSYFFRPYGDKPLISDIVL